MHLRKVGGAGKGAVGGHTIGHMDDMIGQTGQLVYVSFAQVSSEGIGTVMVLGIKLGHDTKNGKGRGNKCLA